jgi:TolB protein
MRVVTEQHPHWLAAAYGNEESRASGSNMIAWSPNEAVLSYSPMAPDSRTAWRAKQHVEKDDHFNRNYVPEEARGGCRIAVLDPFTRESKALTPLVEHTWDFRAAWSRDGGRVVFCRARIGEAPELWVMDADGGNARVLTTGRLNLGADHPFWL